MSQNQTLLIVEQYQIERIQLDELQKASNIVINFNPIKEEINEILKQLLEKLSDETYQFQNCKNFSLILEGDKQYEETIYEQLQKICQIFKNATIVSFDIGFENNFNGKSVELLSESLKTYSKIEAFQLNIRAENKFMHADLQYFTNILKDQNKINTLNLCIEMGNELGLEGTKYIQQVISNNSSLKQLSLRFEDNQKIGQEGAVNIGQSIQTLSGLEGLQLIIGGNNKIKNEGMTSISLGIAKQTNLKNIRLFVGYNNQIQNEGTQSLGKSFSNLKELTTLRLNIQDQNEIQEEGFNAVAEGLKNSLKLEQIYIKIGNYNSIKNKGIEELGSTFENLKEVKHLRLCLGSYNEINSLEKLANGIKNMEKLEEVYITFQKHSLVGQDNLGFFSESFRDKTNLKKLSFHVQKNPTVEIQNALKIVQRLAKQQNIEQINFVIEEQIYYIFESAKKSAFLKLSSVLNEQCQEVLQNTLSVLNQSLRNFTLHFDSLADLNKYSGEAITKSFSQGDTLEYLYISIQSCAKFPLRQIVNLFQKQIEGNRIVYTELVIMDTVQMEIKNFNNIAKLPKIQNDGENDKSIKKPKTFGKELSIVVHPYSNCGKKGSQAICELLQSDQIQNQVRKIKLNIKLDNKINQAHSKIIAEALLKCSYVTEYNFLLEENQQAQGVLWLRFKQLKAMFDKVGTDRQRILNTYLKFFSKTKKSISKEQTQPKEFIKETSNHLNLMKDFTLVQLQQMANQQQNFGGGFNQQNGQVSVETLDDQEDFHQQRSVIEPNKWIFEQEEDDDI